MTDASRACITLLAACNTCQWLIRFLEYIYRSSMDDHDRHMEILIGCALIEFAFFHYVYTWVCWLLVMPPGLPPGELLTKFFENQAKENFYPYPSTRMNLKRTRIRRRPSQRGDPNRSIANAASSTGSSAILSQFRNEHFPGISRIALIQVRHGPLLLTSLSWTLTEIR